MKNLDKLLSWLQTSEYDGVILGRRDNFKWITEENANAVVTNAEVGVAHLLIEKDGSVTVAADSSDCPRMETEQNALRAKGMLIPWYESFEAHLKDYIGDRTFASDTGIAGTDNVQSELINVRMQLSEKELKRYRKIGQECAGIVEGVAMNARPGQTEQEIADKIRTGCIAKGISPDCVLVGSDERILNYRHPVPTSKKIEKSLMVVLGGEKYGLNISMTRMVYFVPVPEEIKGRMQKTQKIFAAMQNLMKNGMSYQAYFRKVQELYAKEGCPEEWKMHHQGGPTGYGCREFTVTPETKGVIKKNQAYAWNPTIAGTKCEETTFLTDKCVGIFTRTKAWPCTVIETEYGSCSVADILYIKNE